MQIILHHGFGDRAVVFNQLRAEIDVEDVFAVTEPGKRFVDLENFPALRAERLAARENAKQDDFRAEILAMPSDGVNSGLNGWRLFPYRAERPDNFAEKFIQDLREAGVNRGETADQPFVACEMFESRADACGVEMFVSEQEEQNRQRAEDHL